MNSSAEVFILEAIWFAIALTKVWGEHEGEGSGNLSLVVDGTTKAEQVSGPFYAWLVWPQNHLQHEQLEIEIFTSLMLGVVLCVFVWRMYEFLYQSTSQTVLCFTALSRLPHIRQELKCLRDNSSQIRNPRSQTTSSTGKLFSPTYWKIQGIQFKVWGMLQFVSPLATWITIPQLLDWWTFRISSEFRMSIARMLVLSCTSCPKKTCTFIFHASSTSCLSKMVYLIYLCCYFGVL